jgi:hypothetical protein
LWPQLDSILRGQIDITDEFVVLVFRVSLIDLI